MSAQQLGDNPTIRVLINDAETTFRLATKSAVQLSIRSGRILGNIPPGSNIALRSEDNGVRLECLQVIWQDEPATSAVMVSEPLVLESTNGFTRIGIGIGGAAPRDYEGRLEIHPRGEKLALILSLPVEEYLRGVVPSEIGGDSPAEAQRAQAVAARSEAVLALTSRIYAGPEFDICSTVQCQVFSGASRRTAAADDAVRATRGIILSVDGKPIPAFYAAMCGGHGEDIRNIWPDRSKMTSYHDIAQVDGTTSSTTDLSDEENFHQWIDSSPPVWCNPKHAQTPDWTARNFRWTREFSAEDVSRFVATIKDIGRVRAIRPVRRGKSGRIPEIEFIGDNGSVKVAQDIRIRRLFNPALRSSAFYIDIKGDLARPDAFVFHGGGSGHGVGMCQTGAMGMANAGRSFREILQHYYPKAKVEKIY